MYLFGNAGNAMRCSVNWRLAGAKINDRGMILYTDLFMESNAINKFTLLLFPCLRIAHFFIDSREENNYQLCIYTYYCLACG